VILNDVWDQLAERLRTIPDLRVYARPTDDVKVPSTGAAAVVSYPQDIVYDLTYGRGTDELDQPIVLTMPDPESARTAARLSAFVAGSGPSSIKAALEPTGYTAFDRVVVERAEFDVYTMAGTEVMVAIFHCKITGDGATI
jgi:hypothetical protein